MPQNDISFHNIANCESVDLLIRQSNSGLWSRQKNLTTPITTPESKNFSLLTLTRMPTPSSVSRLSNLFALHQIIKHEKNPGCFSKRGNNFKIALMLDGHKLLKIIKSVLRSTMSQEQLSDLSILGVENDKLRLIDFDDTIEEFIARKSRRRVF